MRTWLVSWNRAIQIQIQNLLTDEAYPVRIWLTSWNRAIQTQICQQQHPEHFCNPQQQSTHAVRSTVTAMAMFTQEQGLRNLLLRPSTIFPRSLPLSFKTWRAYFSAGIPCYSAVLMQCIQCKIYVSICIISPIISLHSATCLFSLLSIGASPPAARVATDPLDTAPSLRSSPPCPLPSSSTPLSLQHATKASPQLSIWAECLHQAAVVRITRHITKGHAAVHPYAAPGMGKKAIEEPPPSQSAHADLPRSSCPTY